MKDIPREPTYEEIARHDIIDGWVACWYPQMGGYCGKALIRLDTDGDPPSPDGTDCFEVLVWHDGQFPFTDGELSGYVSFDEDWNQTEEYRRPAHLHHCSYDQFIEFGNLVREKLYQ